MILKEELLIRLIFTFYKKFLLDVTSDHFKCDVGDIW